MGGPVVTAARAALQKGDITPVLRWVKPEAEPELKAVFYKTRAARKKGGAAREKPGTLPGKNPGRFPDFHSETRQVRLGGGRNRRCAVVGR
jgi:hypothetical protein